MQFRIIPAIFVFLGSYFPLAIILALQDISEDVWRSSLCTNLQDCSWPQFEHPWLSISGMCVTGICLILTLKILSTLRFKYVIDVVESKSVPSELISYSFPYIVSFMGVDYGAAGKIAGLFAFLVWLFLITYRAGQIIMNPILLLVGWNLYEAKVRINGHDRIVKLLSRECPVPGKYNCQEVQGSYISDGRSGV